MAQNLYNDSTFFSAYAALPRSALGLAGAPEWTTMRQLVGSVQGLDVLDLGCGLGWFCRWAEDEGVQSVHGVDISTNMLSRAKAMRPDSSVISYECRDLEAEDLTGLHNNGEKDQETSGERNLAQYDLVYSSLALHYLPDLKTLFAQIVQILRPGGRFVFSVEHPAGTAPRDPKFVTHASNEERRPGNVSGGETSVGYWKLSNYHSEGLRWTNFLGTENVRKFHHRTETYLTTLLESGFALEAFRESWDGMLEGKTGWEEFGVAHRPFFLMIAAKLR